MEIKILSLASLFVIGTMSVFAQSKTEKFEVKGSCGMCEKRIEKTAKAARGVSTADWNLETKMIEVTFDESKTDLDKIQAAIAKVGHDTGKYKADDDVYSKLPACCKYDRENTTTDK